MKNSVLSTRFISATREMSSLSHNVPAPYFRKIFIMGERAQEAKLYICGLGFYRLWLNGVEITKGELAPYVSNPDELLYYDEYDLTNRLIQGRNVIGVQLGNGFQNSIGGWPWDFDCARWRSSPKLALSFYVNGEKFFEGDESFKVASSPLLFDDLRMGEVYDARLEIVGWNEVDFDDGGWEHAFVCETPLGEPTLCGAEPIGVLREIKPVRFFRNDGGYVFDFGINTSGVCRLRINGYTGQKITLSHGEILLEDKSVYTKNTCVPQADAFLSQRDTYICKGGEEEYTPHFTFHGFRYVFLEGIGGDQVSLDTLTLVQLGSTLKQSGAFTCSNQIVNDLQRITVNSDISNFFYYPLDCPQREKNGWTADAALSCEQMNFNFDCYDSLREWLKNIRYTQAKNGGLPGIIPTAGWGFAWGNGPSWDIVLTELPYRLYLFTGKMEILEENAEAIKKYIDYLQTRKNEDGLFSFGLGDWCEVDGADEGCHSTPLEVTDTLSCLEIYEKAAFIFSQLKDEKGEEYCRSLRKELLESFRRKYVDENAYINCRTQTAQAKAISLHVFTEEEMPKAVKNLVALIHEKGDRFIVGVIGARVLFRVLCDHGYAELALKLIIQDGFPSYKYWLDKGATSLWEGFNQTYPNSIFRKDGGRVLSLNHHFWGDISALFYRYLLGINLNPEGRDCTLVEINPHFVKDLEYAKGYYKNDNGGIFLSWERKDAFVELCVRTEGEFHFVLSKALESVKRIDTDRGTKFEICF